MKNFILVLMVVLSATAYSQNCYNRVQTGEGTYYDGVANSSTGNCSLPVAAGDFRHCALNNFDYDGSEACDACIRVTGPLGTSDILKVVDRCPECSPGDVDMTQQVFAQIANVSAGRVPISWEFVTCPLSSNNNKIKVKFKEGSTQYWTAIQLRNLKHPLKKLEYMKNGNWVNMPRQLYNYFIASSGISSPMKLRATSVHGQKIVFNNITLNVNQLHNTGKQFSNCSGGDNGGGNGGSIPGKIEAEDYTSQNGVRTESTSDSGGGRNVGWINGGDYMNYKVNVPQARCYRVKFRVAAQSNRIRFDLKRGSNTIKTINSNTTGGWQNWKTITEIIWLPQGEHTLQIKATGGGWNINWMKFENSSCGGSKLSTEEGITVAAYPNPMGTSDNLFVDVELPENNDIEVAVFDIQGRQVYTKMYSGLDYNGGDTIVLDTNTAFKNQKGVYILRITSGTYSKAIKVMR